MVKFNMNEIIKYNKHYVVHFKKDLELTPIQISEMWWKQLMKDLNANDFVVINWEYHNKYNIILIKPFEIQDWVFRLLEKENKDTQKKVRDFMKLYKKELTMWIMENMIAKAKDL